MKLKIILNLSHFPLWFLIFQWNYRQSEAWLFSRAKTQEFLNRNAPVEAYLDTSELIHRYEYPLEKHTVETEDGYNLTLFRIPYGKEGLNVEFNNDTDQGSPVVVGRGVVFLQHGYIASSDIWLLLGKNSLPYLLADQGYDVWLGNLRGTEYASHATLSKEDPKYWDYSQHEMGKYDVPAMVNYVLNTTGENQLTWIGHSMGTTVYFIAMDLYPQLQNSIKNAVLMAPIAYMCNVKSPILLLSQLRTQTLEVFFKSLTGARTLPSWLIRWVNKYAPRVCARGFSRVCWHLYSILGGANPAQYDRDIIAKAIGHVPADSSARTGIHYAQGMNDTSCMFRRYDYGQDKNFQLYGKQSPPIYNLTKINVPTLAMHGGGDWLSAPKDALRTISELQNVQKSMKIKDPMFAHFDYILGKDALILVYKLVLDFLSETSL